ncbi:MAG: M24 family metallopeptidase [Promethearchaeota archaeon]
MNIFQRTKKILEKHNIDGWLVISNEGNDIHAQYLLDVEAHILHFVFISRDGKDHVISCVMEAPMIRKALDRQGIDAEVSTYNSFKDIGSILQKILPDKKIALDFGEDVFSPNGTGYAEFIPVGIYNALIKFSPTAKFVSAAPIIYELRSVKSPQDIEDLQHATKATMEILENVPNWVKIGMTEKEIKAKLEYEYLKIGTLSFPAIVANNEHAADPHHNCSDKKLEKGVLLIDSGVKTRRVCSDITWTYWVGGNPPEEFLQAYDALYYSKEISYKYIKAGAPVNVPAIKCREALKERGYDTDKLYIHGLAHSIGFVVHDIGPGMSARTDPKHVLVENMVYSNEPGLYWPGKWGVRLEDDLVVGKDEPIIVSYNHKDPPLI